MCARLPRGGLSHGRLLWSRRLRKVDAGFLLPGRAQGVRGISFKKKTHRKPTNLRAFRHEGMTPINYPLWFPLRKSPALVPKPGRSFPYRTSKPKAIRDPNPFLTKKKNPLARKSLWRVLSSGLTDSHFLHTRNFRVIFLGVAAISAAMCCDFFQRRESREGHGLSFQEKDGSWGIH